MPEKNRKSDLYATSTVGMSIYNLLASTGRIIDAGGLHSTLERIQLPGLERYLVDRALEMLVDRQMIVREDSGYRCSTPQDGIMVRRDRSDFRFNPETGEYEGGWNGWTGIRNGVLPPSYRPSIAGVIS